MNIEVTPNTFKIILPNMNAFTREEEKTITPQMQTILDFIRENGSITDLQIQELLGLRKTRAFNLAKQMREMELIASIGRGSEKKVYCQSMTESVFLCLTEIKIASHALYMGGGIEVLFFDLEIFVPEIHYVLSK